MTESGSEINSKILILENELKNPKQFKNKLIDLYLLEFEENFSDLLILDKNKYLDRFGEKISLILSDKFSESCFDNDEFLKLLDSVEHIFINNYYEVSHEFLKGKMQEINNENENNYIRKPLYSKRASSEVDRNIFIHPDKMYLKNFTKHCVNTQEFAMHSCGGKYLLLKNQQTKFEYVVCEFCQESYLSSYIKMFCNECSEVYFSSIKDDDYDPNMQLVTWEKYHCSAVIKDCIKCPKCKGKFYLNIKSKKLICENCQFEIKPEEMEYNCLVCKKDFTSKLKIYNPIEFDIIKISIKNALLYKVPCQPDFLPCCKEDIKSVKNFFHKKECSGILYSGEWINNKIAVCSKCKMLSEIEKYVWTCPICLQRFKNSESKKSSQNKLSIANSTNCTVSPNPTSDSSPSSNSNNTINSIIQSPNINGEINYLLKNKNSDIDLENLKVTDSSKVKSILSNLEKIPMQKRKVTITSAKSNLDFSPNSRIKPNKKSSEEKILNPFDFKNLNKNGKIQQVRNEISPNTKNIIYKDERKKEIQTNNAIKNYKPVEKETEIIIQNSNEYDTLEDENLKQFDYEDFKVITQIGEGSFGKIYLVEDKYQRQFSMKKIIANDDIDVENFTQEYELVNKVRHKNILRIHSICRRKLDSTTHALYILMEKGVTDWDKEIKARQNQKKFYSEKEIFNILGQLTEALAFMQNKNISHRDIKPQNVLLFKEGIFKIADFGEAKRISIIETSKQLSTLRGTELYMSPLLFNGLRTGLNDIKHNSFKSDVFSLAFCVLYAATLNIHCLYELRRETDTFTIGVKLGRMLKGKYTDKLFNVLMKMIDINEVKRSDFIDLKAFLDSLK